MLVEERYFLNSDVIAMIRGVRERPLWWVIAFQPGRVEEIFGKGNEAIQALGVFAGNK